MSLISVPDFLMLDYYAEFVFLPTERARELYLLSDSGYRDAICKIIQVLVMGRMIGLPHRSYKLEATKALCETSPFAKSITTGAHQDSDEDRLRQISFQLLHDNKALLETIIISDKRLLERIKQHAAREAYYYWHLHDDYIRSAYLPENKCLSFDNDHIINPLENFLFFRRKTYPRIPEGGDLREYINLYLSSHFTNMFGLITGLSKGTEYIAGFTRGTLIRALASTNKKRQNDDEELDTLKHKMESFAWPVFALLILRNARTRREIPDIALQYVEGKGPWLNKPQPFLRTYKSIMQIMSADPMYTSKARSLFKKLQQDAYAELYPRNATLSIIDPRDLGLDQHAAAHIICWLPDGHADVEMDNQCKRLLDIG